MTSRTMEIRLIVACFKARPNPSDPAQRVLVPVKVRCRMTQTADEDHYAAAENYVEQAGYEFPAIAIDESDAIDGLFDGLNFTDAPVVDITGER